jgi:6-phospho-beta-glucosidase
MKIAVIGGAGTRVPLLAGGLARSDLPLEEIALYDTDRDRLDLVAPLAARTAKTVRVRACATVEEAVEGAAFVFLSIREGGGARRARDEAIALAHGIAGQETVGPAGFALALRTAGPAAAYARAVARRAPRAWIVNFTNPVGIVTQAILTETARAVGICDTPLELCEHAARTLGLPPRECHFDYFGLNHLGWLREVYHRGEPRLSPLWDDPDALERLLPSPLFDGRLLARLRLLPTEYLFFYYRPETALENLRRAGTSRGAVVEALNARLFDALRRADEDPVAVYARYLAAREAGYMQLESGAAAPRAPLEDRELAGYDRIALAVVRAIHFDTGAVLPLDVPNRGNLPGLEPDDVVEVPCAVTANGPLPLHVPPPPEPAAALVARVKRYERLTLRAALARDEAAAREALAINPLVGDRATADRLFDALQPL